MYKILDLDVSYKQEEKDNQLEEIQCSQNAHHTINKIFECKKRDASPSKEGTRNHQVSTQNQLLQLLLLPTLPHHPPKNPLLAPHQLPRRPKLRHFSIIQHQNLIKITNRA
jgi:hypothetical protein